MPVEPVCRRRLLATVAGAVAVGGCAVGPSSTSTDAPRSATTSASPTTDPGTVPPWRAFSPTAVAADGHALTAERWFALEAVRYRTDGGHATVEPFGDRFVGYDFRLANRGEDRLAAVPDTEFSLRVAGETHEHVHALRGDVPFSRVDQPENEPTIQPLRWYEGLAPGDAVRLQLVFDVPVAPDARHYLAWRHDGAVEGSTEPAFVFPTPD